MLEIMAERVANNWAGLTADPEIREAKERDWGAFFEQVIAFITQLLPLFADLCPTDPARVKVRARAWQDALEGGRRELRALGLIERWRLRRWQAKVNRELGSELCSEFDTEEFQVAMLQTAAEAAPDELVQLRVEADRLRDEAA